ncbi:MAG: GNAT family N-acetyltransferase [Candidatus Magasanikbacteria bacterium]|jgi:GNAT superfamily N-acetyltransferase|nr:GNAT family N-acetyltransferase [Candidatus Magasanikbacteria bacterium]MBT4221195.1 GNAT family N-acetyltransferase [Candidatus Magasanikbacteria bacterium]MBT4350037.1 GNAT family N-acetyltransferase [Candidatus Magasanikbacteria bacterium]MBT4541985.1 GNAT family N-acetyltransferase [Candidatus Magasanikbacteria bacterium]MBT6252740.1 GNAT family N-acetyltransferase [Candidatus Magasanikbacteria bacterium]
MQVEEHIDGRAKAFRLFVKEDGKEIGHIRLYLIYNDFHEGPYGLFEYIFVDPDYRGKGVGTLLVRRLIALAKEQGCYKLIAQARRGRNGIHGWYEALGFTNHGLNFRIDF